MCIRFRGCAQSARTDGVPRFALRRHACNSGDIVPSIRNKTRQPLSIRLRGGKTLHLSPGKDGQISSKDADDPAVATRVAAGDLEVVDAGASTPTAAGGGRNARTLDAHGRNTGGRRRGGRRSPRRPRARLPGGAAKRLGRGGGLSPRPAATPPGGRKDGRGAGGR